MDKVEATQMIQDILNELTILDAQDVIMECFSYVRDQKEAAIKGVPLLHLESQNDDITEIVKTAHDAKRESRQAMHWSVTALVISIVVGVIRIAVVVLPHL